MNPKDHVSPFDRPDLLQEQAEDKEFVDALRDVEEKLSQICLRPVDTKERTVYQVLTETNKVILIFTDGRYCVFHAEMDSYEDYAYLSHTQLDAEDGIRCGLVYGLVDGYACRERYLAAKEVVNNRQKVQREKSEREQTASFLQTLVTTYGKGNVLQMLDNTKE